MPSLSESELFYLWQHFYPELQIEDMEFSKL
jgi:hypothetical protein